MFMPNKFPPLNFVPNRRIEFQAQRLEKIPLGASFQCTRSHLSSFERKEVGVHRISSIHSGDLGGDQIHFIPTIIQLNLASFLKPESIIILTLKNSTKGSNICQLSNHSEIERQLESIIKPTRK